MYTVLIKIHFAMLFYQIYIRVHAFFSLVNCVNVAKKRKFDIVSIFFFVSVNFMFYIKGSSVATYRVECRYMLS